jgi:hypothetical protein
MTLFLLAGNHGKWGAEEAGGEEGVSLGEVLILDLKPPTSQCRNKKTKMKPPYPKSGSQRTKTQIKTKTQPPSLKLSTSTPTTKPETSNLKH